MPHKEEEIQNFMIPSGQEEEIPEEKLGRRSWRFLPEELIFQILEELPAKTLLRFRSVSKLWCTIIDDPKFVQRHLARSHTRSHGIKHFFIRLRNDIDAVIISYCEFFRVDAELGGGGGGAAASFRLHGMLKDDDDHHQPVHLYPTNYVNGLVCFRDRIWNPATSQCIRIPYFLLLELCPMEHSPAKRFDIIDPGFRSMNLFGYDSSSNAYKVLQLVWFMDDLNGPPRCKVWTVGTSVWRDFDVSNMPYDFLYLEEGKACAIDHVIYCLGGVGVSDNGERYIGPREFKIFAFDVRHEKLTNIVALPAVSGQFGTSSSKAWSLINVRGQLGLVHDDTMATIFVLGQKEEEEEEEGSSSYWSEEKLLLPHEWRVRSSPKSGYLNSHDPVKQGFTLVGSLPTGNVIIFQLTELDHDQKSKEIRTANYFYYDLVTKNTSKFLDLTGLPGALTPQALILSYAESVFRLPEDKLVDSLRRTSHFTVRGQSYSTSFLEEFMLWDRASFVMDSLLIVYDR